MDLKDAMRTRLRALLAEHIAERALPAWWREPVVRFGDARHPDYPRLRDIAVPDHFLPEDFLPGARTVISYFLPFAESVAAGNVDGPDASAEWAAAYLAANAMAAAVNPRLADAVRNLGFRAAVPEGIGFDPARLMSRWSQRHVAWLAGHGTFGINNMLIGEKGCCGRYFSIVTDLPVEPDAVAREEACLYRRDGRCGVCARRCPAGALAPGGFDRRRCWVQCEVNERRYPDAHVCGKCDVGLPCSFRRPAEDGRKGEGP